MRNVESHEVPNELLRPKWLEDFEGYVGRPLRVLNLGNIANNAFQNSKIMRRAGIDADCVAYDYYHVMGTAEWEDADFRGSIGDQFHPDWWRVKFNKYSRPKWFIQGPKEQCLSYIHSLYRNGENSKESIKLWKSLALDTHRENFNRSSLSKIPGNPLLLPNWIWRRIQFSWFLLKTYVKSPFLLGRRFEKQFQYLANIGTSFFTLIGLPFALGFLLLSVIFDKFMHVVAIIPKDNRSNYLELRRAMRKIRIANLKRRLYPIVYSFTGWGANLFRRFTGRRFGAVFGDKMADEITQFLGVRSKVQDSITVNMSTMEIQARRAERRAKRERAKADPEDISSLSPLENNLTEEEQDRRSETIAQVYYSAYLYYLERVHPDQGWVLDHYAQNADKPHQDIWQDIVVAKVLAEEWEGIFEYYDVVLAYSTDGILSMAGSDMPFYTYEHGTLRSIPFENTTMGRLCASSYRNCESLMLTNLDTLEKPKLLDMRPDQVVFLPHAVDDRKLLGFKYLQTAAIVGRKLPSSKELSWLSVGLLVATVPVNVGADSFGYSMTWFVFALPVCVLATRNVETI